MLSFIMISMIFKVCVRLPYDIYYLVQEAPSQDPNVPYYEQETYLYSAVTITYQYLGYSILSLAIIINMTRWILLYLIIKQYPYI